MSINGDHPPEERTTVLRAFYGVATVLLMACASSPIAAQSNDRVNGQAGAPHSGFVTVNGVRLHYLDWGGSGSVVVLLAGLGNTAWIWSDFAPLLANGRRVVALTRRGYGESEQPTSGYELDTLAADLTVFLDSLGIRSAHFVGHSLGGFEITRLATLHPERLVTLTYLDAAYDPSGFQTVLMSDPVRPPSPEPRDRASIDAYVAFIRNSRPDLGRYWSEGLARDLRASQGFQPDGRVAPRTAARISTAIMTDILSQVPDYEAIAIPSLAIYSAERNFDPLPADASAELRGRYRHYLDTVVTPWRNVSIEQFRAGRRDVHVVELDAGHYLFLQRPADVARLIDDFITPK